MLFDRVILGSGFVRIWGLKLTVTSRLWSGGCSWRRVFHFSVAVIWEKTVSRELYDLTSGQSEGDLPKHFRVFVLQKVINSGHV